MVAIKLAKFSTTWQNSSIALSAKISTELSAKLSAKASQRGVGESEMGQRGYDRTG